MALVLKREEGQSWKDAAIAAGKPYGLQEDVAEAYDSNKKLGFSDEDAAWGAALEWDVLELVQ